MEKIEFKFQAVKLKKNNLIYMLTQTCFKFKRKFKPQEKGVLKIT